MVDRYTPVIYPGTCECGGKAEVHMETAPTKELVCVCNWVRYEDYKRLLLAFKRVSRLSHYTDQELNDYAEAVID